MAIVRRFGPSYSGTLTPLELLMPSNWRCLTRNYLYDFLGKKIPNHGTNESVSGPV